MMTRLQLKALVGLLAVALGAGIVEAHPPVAPAKPADVPWTLVPSGVTSFSLVAPEYKVFWHSAPPNCPTSAPQGIAATAVITGELISRIGSYGSSPRDLYHQAICGNAQILSNIVADANYVYFTTSNGLMRLSVDANPGDSPELMNGLYGGQAELAIDDINIFVLQLSSNGIYFVPKASPLNGYYEVTPTGSNPYNLQTSFSFSGGHSHYFVYWIEGGTLKRYDIPNFSGPATLATGVTGYYAEGGRTSCDINNCFFTDVVFYGVGDQAFYYNNLATINPNHGPIYTSTDNTASVVSLTADDNNLFLIESRDANCFPFSCSVDVLVRTGRSNDNNKAPIYTTPQPVDLLRPDRLTTDGSYLFWQDRSDGALRGLANDAAALAQTNMWITGLEVTQGIQSLNNAVFLVQNRRTFVRMYVQSDFPGVDTVGAQLEATWNGGSSDLPLTPINPVGTRLTVRTIPNRNDINESFLFELPLDWTTHTNLVLTAELNPYKVPLENDYTDDTMAIGPLSFSASPRVVVNLVQMSYTLTGTIFTVPLTDTQNAISLVRRLWPVASTPGDYTNSSPGFRPRVWTLYDSGLGSRMNYSAQECSAYYQNVNGVITDTRNLCPSAYVDNRLIAYRSEQGLPDDSFLYGLVPPAPGYGIRGQAFSGARVSSGASTATSTAAHEITHTAGRSHPFKGSSLDTGKCGNTPADGAMDNAYPYANSSIGPLDGSYEGFETGDPALKIKPAVLPSANWFDIIGYCGPRWISDYTYQAIYNFFPHLQAPSPLALAAQLTPDVAGDWLGAYGIIAADGNSAWFDHLQRSSNIASVPTVVPGGYSLRQFDVHGNTLADHSFTPGLIHHGGGVMDFGLEVPFAVGTTQIQLIKSPNQVIASQTVSANPPVINNVALSGAPNPVTGTVTLGWTASDADGDPLTFDVLYTRDGGATFQPVVFGVTGNQTLLDTRRLGGGTARLRVIASDGLLTAQADSAPFTMANKPPAARIDSPGNGDHFHFGQLVALMGEADDPQGAGVSGSGLVWTDQRGDVLGTGTAVYTTNLPVGMDVITLTATNNLAMSAATHITVTVDDDLRLLGPTLSVGPSQVSWQIAPGTAAAQTADVGIANVGGGSLSWTAGSDQSWLTLGALSGSAPFTLPLSANPAGMTNGQTRTAHVTITKPADGGPQQSIMIPVQIAMGNVEDGPIAVYVLNNRVYLPLIRR
jgi:hypothetical protein